MWEMARSSIVLFFKGRLFQDPAMVYRQLGIGVAITVIVVLALAFAGLPLWLSAAAAGFLGGLAQPWLFRNLKYQ